MSWTTLTMNKLLRRNQILIWLIWVAYCALIIYLSHQPGDPNYVAPFEHIDKAQHFIEYAVFGALLLSALSTVCKKHILSIMIPVTLLFAASDEIHQSFIPFREASVGDLLADLAGASVAIMLFFFLRSRMSGDGDQAISD